MKERETETLKRGKKRDHSHRFAILERERYFPKEGLVSSEVYRFHPVLSRLTRRDWGNWFSFFCKSKRPSWVITRRTGMTEVVKTGGRSTVKILSQKEGNVTWLWWEENLWSFALAKDCSLVYAVIEDDVKWQESEGDRMRFSHECYLEWRSPEEMCSSLPLFPASPIHLISPVEIRNCLFSLKLKNLKEFLWLRETREKKSLGREADY